MYITAVIEGSCSIFGALLLTYDEASGGRVLVVDTQ